MNDFYVAQWGRLRTIEGASQRIQEDTMRFAQTIEDLGLAGGFLFLASVGPGAWSVDRFGRR